VAKNRFLFCNLLALTQNPRLPGFFPGSRFRFNAENHFRRTEQQALESDTRLSRIQWSKTPYCSVNDEMVSQKRGRNQLAKWPEGCSALLVPAPFSEACQSTTTNGDFL